MNSLAIFPPRASGWEVGAPLAIVTGSTLTPPYFLELVEFRDLEEDSD